MATLITETTARGTRRCDARCYNAKGPDCRCCCGGRHHGQGLRRAVEASREWAAEQGVEVPSVQSELWEEEPDEPEQRRSEAMIAMKEHYNLPSGETTTEPETYVDAWRSLARGVEAALPGWECYAFDPGVSLRRSNGRGGILELPLDVAQRVANLERALNGLERAVVEASG